MRNKHMGTVVVADAFDAVAEVFWSRTPPDRPPGRQAALRALDALGKRAHGIDVNTEDAMRDPGSPIGRLIAIAFEATPEEVMDIDGAWCEGPVSRFRDRYDLR